MTDRIPRETHPIAQAVILCGGLGTRLGALTARTPKPLLPVDGRPFLEGLLAEVARHGLRRILLLAAFESEAVVAFAREAERRLGVSIAIAVEPARAGTGGALWHARDRLDPRFLLLNGDSWFDVNLLDLARRAAEAEATGALGTLALRAVPDAARFGTVAVDGTRIVRFTEKTGIAGPALVNGGVYVLRREIVDALSPDCSLERDGLAPLAEAGRLTGHVHDGFFLDIGVPEDYARAETAVPAARRRGAVFLDRDGVLNADLGYVGTRERFVWLDGAREAVRRLNDLGLFVFLVTNQAGVARGYYGEDAVADLHAHVRAELAAAGAHLDDIRYCPFHPEGSVPAYAWASEHRKPAPGMLLDLMAAWPVDRTRCLMIGDQASDAEAGTNAGIRSYRLAPGESLGQALDHLLPGLMA